MYIENYATQDKYQKLKYPPIKEHQRTNAAFMIENSLHPPFVSIDRTIFIKTKEEKLQVNLAKARHRGTLLTINTSAKKSFK